MSNYGKSLYLNVTDFKKMLFREKRLENRINFEEIQRKFKAKSPPRSPQKKTTVISNDNQTSQNSNFQHTQDINIRNNNNNNGLTIFKYFQSPKYCFVFLN